MFGLANPDRFLRFTRPLMPAVWGLAVVLLAVATWQAFAVPEDFRQGDTMRIIFVHAPAATVGLAAYVLFAAVVTPFAGAAAIRNVQG